MNRCFICIRGQALVESLLIIVIFSAIFFAGIQLCIIAVNDIIFNEAAFSTMRVVAVSKYRTINEIKNDAQKATQHLLTPHITSSQNNITNYQTRIWHEDPQGKDDRDLSGNEIRKYNTNIKYQTKIMFSSLLNPLKKIPFFSGGTNFVTQTARARMVKSLDEKYYYKAFPGAENFGAE